MVMTARVFRDYWIVTRKRTVTAPPAGTFAIAGLRTVSVVTPADTVRKQPSVSGPLDSATQYVVVEPTVMLTSEAPLLYAAGKNAVWIGNASVIATVSAVAPPLLVSVRTYSTRAPGIGLKNGAVLTKSSMTELALMTVNAAVTIAYWSRSLTVALGSANTMSTPEVSAPLFGVSAASVVGSRATPVSSTFCQVP